MNLDPGAAGLDEGHQLALVVGGAAGADHAAAVGERVDLRIEGLRVPQVQRVDRLHVVVAVEKEAGPVRPLLGQRVAMGHDHGVAGGGTHLRVEAERGQLPRQPLRRGGAVGLVGGIGRDGGEAQQVEQPLEPRVEILVEAVQDGGKGGMGHRRLREGERIAAEPALGRRIRQPAPRGRPLGTLQGTEGAPVPHSRPSPRMPELRRGPGQGRAAFGGRCAIPDPGPAGALHGISDGRLRGTGARAPLAGGRPGARQSRAARWRARALSWSETPSSGASWRRKASSSGARAPSASATAHSVSITSARSS